MIRLGGNLGAVNLTWMATTDVNTDGADAATDLMGDYGIVTFDIGQTSAIISLLVNPDNVSSFSTNILLFLISHALGIGHNGQT